MLARTGTRVFRMVLCSPACSASLHSPSLPISLGQHGHRHLRALSPLTYASSRVKEGGPADIMRSLQVSLAALVLLLSCLGTATNAMDLQTDKVSERAALPFCGGTADVTRPKR